jgi:hypothetical protein
MANVTNAEALAQQLLVELKRITDHLMPTVPVPKTAAALQAAGATIKNGKISLPLSSVNAVIEGAAEDGISIVLEEMDVSADTAQLVILGTPSDQVRDLGDITSVTDLNAVNKPANSRCQ